MLVTGRLEVFKNRNGYYTAVVKAWDNDNKKVLGKAFMDVSLPGNITCEEGQTLTLNVKEGWINAFYVEKGDFTKLKLNINNAEVESVFPEPKKAKKSKKTSKEDK